MFFLVAGTAGRPKKGPTPKINSSMMTSGDHGGDAQALDPKAGDNDQDQQSGSQAARNRREQNGEWRHASRMPDMPRQQQHQDDGDPGEQGMQQEQPSIQASCGECG